MKPYASPLLTGESQVKIEQAASLLLLSEEGKSERYPGKKKPWEDLICMTRPISILNSTALSLMNLSVAHSLMLAFLFRQLKTSFVNVIFPL